MNSHKFLSYVIFAFLFVFAISMVMTSCGGGSATEPQPVENPDNGDSTPVDETPSLADEPYRLPEVETHEYDGLVLTPIDEQQTTSIKGTQEIERDDYRLMVTGLVDTEISVKYDDLLRLPVHHEVAYMPCVDGWGFWAKWTGFKVTDLLDYAGVQDGATFIMFYSEDGYSTGLPLEYLRDSEIIMAFGLNDITLPPDRGFPFQLVAKLKYGYKWAKWVTKIEVTDQEVRGFWESLGFSQDADSNGPKFDFYPE